MKDIKKIMVKNYPYIKRGIKMNIEEITLDQAKNEYKYIWKAFKAQFPNSDHESIRKMIEVTIAIQKGFVRDESLDD